MRRLRPVTRREFGLFGGAGIWFLSRGTELLRPIVVSVNVMFDRGAHSGRGLSNREVSLFHSYQQEASHEFAVSGMFFDLRFTEGAYLLQRGYSEIAEKFLAPKMINLFVTDALGYDIDRDRTGGSSTGPRPRGPKLAPDPFYKIFLGLKDAREKTLPHEYAHQFTLDTQHSATLTGNLWADLRNDYWLWRQRQGTPILEFRDCAGAEWARIEDR